VEPSSLSPAGVHTANGASIPNSGGFPIFTPPMNYERFSYRYD
jgi:hypothetical protein